MLISGKLLKVTDRASIFPPSFLSSQRQINKKIVDRE